MSKDDKITVQIVDMTRPRSSTMQGPPVPVEMQQLFGWYRPGLRVTGIATLPCGISVGFEDGSDMIFVPQSYE